MLSCLLTNKSLKSHLSPHIFTNEYKVKQPHEPLLLKSGKIRVSRVSHGPHNFVVYESGKRKKTKGLQTDTHKSSKMGCGGGRGGGFIVLQKGVYIQSHVRQVNVQEINSLKEINICRLCMFVLSLFISSCLSFFLCS